MSCAKIVVRTVTLIGCVCWAVNGQIEPPAPTTTEGSPVKVVNSPFFKPSEITEVAIVWPGSRAYTHWNDLEQAVEDAFVNGLTEKGYIVSGHYGVQPHLVEERSGNQSGLMDIDVLKTGQALHVPAVLVITADLQSQTNNPPPTNSGTSSNQGTSTDAVGTWTNLLHSIPALSNSPFGKWIPSAPSSASPKGGAQAKPPVPKFLNSCSMKAQLLRVEDGVQFWSGSMTTNAVSSSQTDFSGMTATAAVALAQSFPARTEQK